MKGTEERGARRSRSGAPTTEGNRNEAADVPDWRGQPKRLHVEAREAARMLGMSQRAVRKLVASGRLEAEDDGDGAATRVLVSVESVEKLRSERGRSG